MTVVVAFQRLRSTQSLLYDYSIILHRHDTINYVYHPSLEILIIIRRSYNPCQNKLLRKTADKPVS